MNMPTLRFPLQDNKWREEPIISLADYVDYRGKTPKKTESGVFLVTAKNIKQGYIDYESSQEFIDPGEYDEVMRRGKPKIDDVLITTEAPLGNIASVDREDIALAQRVIKYRGKDKILNSCFLKQLFLAPRLQDEIASKATGGTVQGIKGSVLHQIKIYIPDFDEQTMIADFLSSVDEKITLLNKQYDLLCQYKKGMMQKIFTQELRFKDDSGDKFSDWEEVELKKIASKVNTKNRDNSVSTVLTNSAMQGIVSQETYFEREIVTESNLTGYYVVRVGDFVYNPRISSTAPVGPIKMNKLTQGVMSPLYTVFRFEKGLLKFYQYFFESSVWHDYLKSVANSGARHDRMNISGADFFGLPVPQPFEEEQTKIANFLSGLDDKITTKKTELDKLKTWKQGLLQQMFV
ncbi:MULTISPECIES: restriction endonuclease subunit S [Enterobacteriaceae]|uniref:restriction endonuclease subunit S n=1 Tax=Enterobacteriaceae TaxID=543 RepID=UPI0020229BB0|nr:MULTISPECIES: restriction endonuclease subunit S [Enterobacteriaceae]MCL8151406.1 restriction endonuclease subunit S [Enterobacter roggenkampii]MCM7559777.1 restriction endonuclease subunit S [Enterobacter roggenkampii]MDU3912864.1 restriction endonuclease subunit S [Kluyvera ascorbata]